MPRCTICKADKSSDSFHKNCNKTNGLKSNCKRCCRKRDSANYQSNRAYILRQVRGSCELCGWNLRPDVLEFDHIKPLMNFNAVRFTTILRHRKISNVDLWDHFNRVQVLCPNCHEIKTKDNGEKMKSKTRRKNVSVQV